MSEVLWSSTPSPGLPDVNESQNVTLGTTVTFAVAGTVSGIQFMAPLTVSGTYDVVLYEATADDSPASTGTGTVLATASAGTPTAGALNTATFSSPVAVSAAASKTYVCALRTSAGRYTATGAFFSASALTVGNITAVKDQTVTALGTMANGRFVGGSITLYPTDTFNGNGYFIGPIFDATGGGAIAPSGIAVAVGLGQPTLANSMDTVSPSGIAVAVGLGQPTLANSMNTVTPNGIAVASAVGTPTLAQSFSVTPTGIAVPVTLGQPTVAQNLGGAIAPTGIAVPVTPGTPTVAGQPYVATVPQGSWWKLKSILDEARVVNQQIVDRGWIACPNDGEPLQRSRDGVQYCPYDGWKPGGRPYPG